MPIHSTGAGILMNHMTSVLGVHVRSTFQSCIDLASMCVLFTCISISTASLSNTGNVTSSMVEAEVDQLITKKLTTNEMLERILEDSGVLSQMSNLPATIIGESEQHWQSCSASDAHLESWINAAFSAEEISRLAVNGLNNALDAQGIVKVVDWLDSASGQTIIDAERASGALSEEEFESYIGKLNASPDFQTERAPRIRTLLSRTRVAEFVSVLNTELNAAVSVATACSPDHDTVKQLLETANIERQNIGLETVFMAINLQAPTAVVYRAVEDAVIDDYLEFAASDAGQAYHEALIKVTRDTLINRLEALGDRMASQAAPLRE